MEIPSFSFRGIHARLLQQLRERVRNGELTERGLARITGISQPHIHNVLKGAKSLSPDLADVILAQLAIPLLELFTRDELSHWLANSNPNREQRLQPVPVLNGLLGLNQPALRKGPHREVHTVPYHLAEAISEPLVACLAGDPEMEPLFADRDMVLLDQSEIARTLFEAESYYIVHTAAGRCVGSLLIPGDVIFLNTDRNRHDSEQWTRIDLAGASILDLVLARVVWLNSRRRWEDHVA